MEQSDSSLPLKDCKLFYHIEKAMDPGQHHLSKNRSRRLTARRRSNSMNVCILPSIPEYPGFQDSKRNYSRHPSANCLGRKRSENLLNTRLVSQNRNQGHSTDHFTNGQCKTKSTFCDKSLQEYYNERLMELRNYDIKKTNGKTKGCADENHNPNPSCRGLRRRSSCSALVQISHMKMIEDTYDAADKVSKGKTVDNDYYQGIGQNCCKKTYLESLTSSVNAPLQMLVQLK